MSDIQSRRGVRRGSVVRSLFAVSALAACAAVLAAAFPAGAAADDADVLREARDRAEIEALMWRYVRALDSFDEDAYAAVFTEDGRFGAGENATQGRDALRQMVAGLEQARAEREAEGQAPAPMYHVITNSHVEFLGEDRARYHSYWMTVFGPAEQGATPRVAAAGRGVDELVRVDGQWLIESRNVAPQD
ncbi:MAG: nuclear transport factor 2 family protein [Gammaproteobacteria bacterium]|nr:nuclear transport factor 2 family protein [Gammaproteobacteria bacterium]